MVDTDTEVDDGIDGADVEMLVDSVEVDLANEVEVEEAGVGT